MKETIKMELGSTNEATNYYEMLCAIIEEEDGLRIFRGNFWVIVTGDGGAITRLRHKLP